MISGARRMAGWAFPLAVLAAALLLRLSGETGIPSYLQNALFDAYQRASPRAYEDPHARSGFAVRYVDIDAESIARYGAWPWPHATLARLVERLKEGGVALVVLAMPLSQPDARGADHLLDGMPPDRNTEALKTALANLPDGDQRLAAALAATPSVSGFLLASRASGPAIVLKANVALIGPGNPREAVPGFAAAEGALAAIEQASQGAGALNLAVDRDGGMRRVALLYRLNGNLVPGIEAEALRLAEKQSDIFVRALQAADGFVTTPTGVASVQAGAVSIPTDASGAMWIRFSPPEEKRKLSATRVIAGEIPPAQLADAIVYVGAGNDVPLATPLGDRRAPAAIRVEAMEGMLLGQFLRRPPAAEQGEILFLATAGLGLVLLLGRLGIVWAGVSLAATAVAGIAFSWHVFATQGLLFDVAYPLSSLALVYLLGLGMRLSAILHERDRLKRTFAQLLPPAALDLVSRRPETLKLAGETRTMSYLVCGVRGFGQLAESFADDPEGLSRLTRRIMTPLADAVLAHRGAVDRLAPGSLSAFFNAPLDDPAHAVNACDCAMRMTMALEKVNRALDQERRADGTPLGPIGIGVGVNTGRGVVADFGTGARPEYTVAGQAANLACEIEALSAGYGPAIIVGETTRKAAERNFAFLEIDLLAAERHSEPVKLYALLGNPLLRASPKFRALQTFHDHIFQSYRAQQWAKARALIEQCRTLSGASQPLYDHYLARIAYFETHPPGPDWDGAFRATFP